MTDLEKARGLAWLVAELESWLDAYGFNPYADARTIGLAANTIRDLCDELEKLEGKLEERDRLTAALEELKENGFLECVVEPACGNCTVCRARKALSQESEKPCDECGGREWVSSELSECCEHRCPKCKPTDKVKYVWCCPLCNPKGELAGGNICFAISHFKYR